MWRYFWNRKILKISSSSVIELLGSQNWVSCCKTIYKVSGFKFKLIHYPLPSTLSSVATTCRKNLTIFVIRVLWLVELACLVYFDWLDLDYNIDLCSPSSSFYLRRESLKPIFILITVHIIEKTINFIKKFNVKKCFPRIIQSVGY